MLGVLHHDSSTVREGVCPYYASDFDFVPKRRSFGQLFALCFRSSLILHLDYNTFLNKQYIMNEGSDDMYKSWGAKSKSDMRGNFFENSQGFLEIVLVI